MTVKEMEQSSIVVQFPDDDKFPLLNEKPAYA
jgi:hypothetical protein